MKSFLNRNKKNLKSINTLKYQRRSSLNIDNNNKDVSSYYKTNKTIQKYVNEKLNLIKNNNNNNISKNISRNNINHNINIKNYSFFTNNSKKNILNKNYEIKNKIKGRNSKNKEIYKNKYNTNYLCDDIPKLLNNKNKENLKKKINNKKINNITNIQNKNITKGKLVKDFYQNYSSSLSMSTGVSLNHNNNEIIKPCNNFLDFNKEKIISSNNNYEIDSVDDDNIIVFKQGENGSSITFGNSFSYTNSKRSNSTKKDNNNNYIDKSIFLLKNQNETLKKELKESNKQITLLKHEIEKLINYKYNINIKNKKGINIKHNKNKSSYLNKNDKSSIYDIDKSSDGRYMQSYKMRILKKDKRKIKK